jgi:hypothetical protein
VPLVQERWLADIGQQVAASLSGVPAAERRTQVFELARRQKQQLVGEHGALTTVERRGALLLAPILQLLSARTARWSAHERGALWELVRAKGARQERTFVRHARMHLRFWTALEQLGSEPL